MAIPVDLNSKNVAKLLKSAEVTADLQKRGERIARAAGPGFEAKAFIGRNRARVTIRAATVEAKLAQENRNALNNAIEAGR